MRRILATLAVVGALLLSAGSAWADWDDGVAAYDSGDYVAAFREWLPLAEQGDADAQYTLGQMYIYGKGVPEDSAAAFKWNHKAAEQGDLDAQYELGRMYMYGEGVPEDSAAAFKWHHRAAEQNHIMSQLNVGVLYSQGLGVFEDKVKAYMWLALAQLPGNREHLRVPKVPGAIMDLISELLGDVKKQMTPVQFHKATTLIKKKWKMINN